VYADDSELTLSLTST